MTFKQIETELYKMFEIDIRQKSRKDYVVKARFLLIHCLFYYSSEIRSLTKIADYMNSQHCNIIHSLNSFDDWISQDQEYKKNADRFIGHIIANTDHLRLEIDLSNKKRKDMLRHRIQAMKKQLKILENS